MTVRLIDDYEFYWLVGGTMVTNLLLLYIILRWPIRSKGKHGS